MKTVCNFCCGVTNYFEIQCCITYTIEKELTILGNNNIHNNILRYWCIFTKIQISNFKFVHLFI